MSPCSGKHLLRSRCGTPKGYPVPSILAPASGDTGLSSRRLRETLALLRGPPPVWLGISGNSCLSPPLNHPSGLWLVTLEPGDIWPACTWKLHRGESHTCLNTRPWNKGRGPCTPSAAGKMQVGRLQGHHCPLLCSTQQEDLGSSVEGVEPTVLLHGWRIRQACGEPTSAPIWLMQRGVLRLRPGHLFFS